MAYDPNDPLEMLKAEAREEGSDYDANVPAVAAAARDMQDALHAILFQVIQGPVLERDACITQARRAYAASKVAGIVGQYIASHAAEPPANTLPTSSRLAQGDAP